MSPPFEQGPDQARYMPSDGSSRGIFMLAFHHLEHHGIMLFNIDFPRSQSSAKYTHKIHSFGKQVSRYYPRADIFSDLSWTISPCSINLVCQKQQVAFFIIQPEMRSQNKTGSKHLVL